MRSPRGILLFFLLLCILGSPVSAGAAESAAAPLFTTEFFKARTQAGLAEMDDTTLIRNLTDLYGKARTLNYPNCFECSLWLIRQAPDTVSSKQLILAEYAVRFSPDLPEAHLNRFNSLVLNRPGDIGLMVSSLVKYAETSLRTPARDAFLGALCRLAMLFSAALYLMMMAVMTLKYGRSLAHLYSHIGSFSLFHMVLGAVVLLSGVVLAFKGIIGPEFFFILWLFFCYRIMRYRELAVLISLLALYLAASIWLALIAHATPPVRSGDLALYRAVYDPPYAEKITASGDEPAAFFALGMQQLYADHYAKADALFDKYAAQVRDTRRSALLYNLRGVCASERGAREAAQKAYAEAIKLDERPEYLFNLSRALYSAGSIREAEELEMRSIAIAGRSNFDYPVVVLPRPYDFFREASAFAPPTGLLHDPLVRRVTAIFLLLLMSGFLWNFGGARIAIARCAECGDIICEECGGTDDEVCLTCRVLKAGKKLVATEEQRAHVRRREKWSAHRRVTSITVSLFAPGAGQIYSDRIIEGIYLSASFLLVCLLFLLPQFFSFVAISSPVPVIMPAIGGVSLVLLWVIGLFRSWRVSHYEE